jgi:hypothetical protein
VLSSPKQVIWALITYTDWWQPATASLFQVGRRGTTFAGDGMAAGLLESLPRREELCERMQQIRASDRRLLYLWYVRQLAADEIARELRISRRQCFRRRAAAIRAIVDAGDPRTCQAPSG